MPRRLPDHRPGQRLPNGSYGDSLEADGSATTSFSVRRRPSSVMTIDPLADSVRLHAARPYRIRRDSRRSASTFPPVWQAGQ